MNTTPSTTTLAAHAVTSALLELLRDMVAQRRAEHQAAVKVIEHHRKNGVQFFGARFCSEISSPAKLKLHVEALGARRRTQRELQVLVPLMRRVLACVQMKAPTQDAINVALKQFCEELARWCHLSKKERNQGSGLYEKPLAIALVSAFPTLLGLPVTAKSEPVSARLPSAMPIEPVRPAIDEKRLKLYNKITSGEQLSGRDIEELRSIFWG